VLPGTTTAFPVRKITYSLKSGPLPEKVVTAKKRENELRRAVPFLEMVMPGKVVTQN